jgi:hypothetical protein
LPFKELYLVRGLKRRGLSSSAAAAWNAHGTYQKEAKSDGGSEEFLLVHV